MRFRITDAELCIRRIVGCMNKEQWQKIGTYSAPHSSFLIQREMGKDNKK
jgi:hypothetical protein